MQHIPNAFTAVRLVAACFFPFAPPGISRLLLLVLGGISDGLDGFLARRWKVESRLGEILDPIADKAFALAVVATYWVQGDLTIFEIIAIASRDIGAGMFGVWLLVKGLIGQYHFKAFYTGKIATTLQFLLFIGIESGMTIPIMYYVVLLLLGASAFIELWFGASQRLIPKQLLK